MPILNSMQRVWYAFQVYRPLFGVVDISVGGLGLSDLADDYLLDLSKGPSKEVGSYAKSR